MVEPPAISVDRDNPALANPPATSMAGEKLGYIKWLDIPRTSKEGWRKVLSLKRNDSVLFFIAKNTFINRLSDYYIGSAYFYNNTTTCNIRSLIGNNSDVKFKTTNSEVSVWCKVSQYSTSKICFIIGKEQEIPMTIEEPPLDANAAE